MPPSPNPAHPLRRLWYDLVVAHLLQHKTDLWPQKAAVCLLLYHSICFCSSKRLLLGVSHKERENIFSHSGILIVCIWEIKINKSPKCDSHSTSAGILEPLQPTLSEANSFQKASWLHLPGPAPPVPCQTRCRTGGEFKCSFIYSISSVLFVCSNVYFIVCLSSSIHMLYGCGLEEVVIKHLIFVCLLWHCLTKHLHEHMCCIKATGK